MQLPPQTRVAGRAEGNESPIVTKSLERPVPRDEEERHAPEITYDEQFYPARPRRFRPSARRSLRRRISDRLTGDGDGAPVADNRAYVEWLVEESMLADANRLASQLSGQGSMWQNPYAHPDPRAALERASVWLTAYPLSFVTRPRRDVPVRARRPRAVAGLPGDRDRRRPHRAGQAGGRPERAPPDARPSTATSTASRCRSTPSSAPRTSSGACARPPPSTRAR